MFAASLKKGFITLAASVPVFTLLCTAAEAGKSDFRVYNDTLATISHLYVTASDENSWAKNVLDGYTLPAGNNVQILFGDPSSERCYYDIRAEFSDGEIVEDFHVNVCESSDYTFFEE
ncbi:MAG: hypothetical protein AAFY78_13900 [Cyanobacteria bacterium J06648_16]